MTAPSVAPDSRPKLPFLRAWWAADRASLLRMIGLALALVSYALLWPSLVEVGGAAPLLRNIAVHAYVVVWLMIVTVGVRSVGSREVLTAFLLGTFLVPTLVFVPLRSVTERLGPNSPELSTWWVPPVEEAALLAGAGLIAWRLCRRPGRRPGGLDLMLVGWAIGTGYAIHEDALYGRFLADLFGDGTIAGAFGGTYGWLFPTFASGLHEGGTGVTVYHPGHGALYGLVLGVVIMLRGRWPRIIWAVPVVWAYATFSHALHNHQGAHGLSPLRVLSGNGHVPAILIMAAIPVLLIVEHRRRQQTRLGLPSLGWSNARQIASRGRNGADTLMRLLALGLYHRGRNAAIAAEQSRPDEPPPDVRGVEAWRRIALS